MSRPTLDYTIPSDHTPPLFAHANLLKESGFVWLRKLLGSTGWAWIMSSTGRGWNYRKGNTFNELKLVQPHLVKASSGSVFPTDQLRQGVFRCRGAGTDFFAEDRATEASEGSGEGVVVVDFQEAWGGMLRGFEDLRSVRGALLGVDIDFWVDGRVEVPRGVTTPAALMNVRPSGRTVGGSIGPIREPDRPEHSHAYQLANQSFRRDVTTRRLADLDRSRIEHLSIPEIVKEWVWYNRPSASTTALGHLLQGSWPVQYRYLTLRPLTARARSRP